MLIRLPQVEGGGEGTGDGYSNWLRRRYCPNLDIPGHYMRGKKMQVTRWNRFEPAIRFWFVDSNLSMSKIKLSMTMELLVVEVRSLSVDGGRKKRFSSSESNDDGRRLSLGRFSR